MSTVVKFASRIRSAETFHILLCRVIRRNLPRRNSETRIISKSPNGAFVLHARIGRNSPLNFAFCLPRRNSHVQRGSLISRRRGVERCHGENTEEVRGNFENFENFGRKAEEEFSRILQPPGFSIGQSLNRRAAGGGRVRFTTEQPREHGQLIPKRGA